MSKPAAIQASYADLRLVKSRKVLQLVFEVPLEKSNDALAVLGGMPDPSAEVWVAVARLQPVAIAPATKPKRTFDEMPAAEQAGMMCQDARFQTYLQERHKVLGGDFAGFVRSWCGVDSRAEIKPNTKALHRWQFLMTDYQGWMRIAEVVPA